MLYVSFIQTFKQKYINMFILIYRKIIVSSGEIFRLGAKCHS